MSAPCPKLQVLAAGPGISVQDLGRFGYLGQGVSASGAADPIAMHEGAALLGQSPALAAIEMAGAGGSFSATQDIRIRLTGAPMAARIGDMPVAWNASHLLPANVALVLGGARGGVYSYLHIGGGVATPPLLGARATNAAAGLGRALVLGDVLALGRDAKAGMLNQRLDPLPRFGGGLLRIVPSLQTGLFSQADLERFCAIPFTRDPRGNRMGVKVLPDGAPFRSEGQLTILSEIIVPGDIQMTGDGVPYVLLNDCQTTGGYPRIGTVLPCDLPRVAQALPGAVLRFAFVSADEGRAALRQTQTALAALPRAVVPLVRDPHQMQDLLSYNLVGGVISALAPDGLDAGPTDANADAGAQPLAEREAR